MSEDFSEKNNRWLKKLSLMEEIKNVREKELMDREKEREEEREHKAKIMAIKEKELQIQAAMRGYCGVATIVLEVVASSDLWIWHAFFGVSGSNNDINVLDHFPVLDDILNDRAPEVNYTINGNNYTMGYYLADDIYPEWATFVKSISKPQGEKRKLFAQYQEGQRKDVERAFGVLQARFAIIRGPARFWKKKKLANIMRACIILHNMIVEDERDTYAGNFAQGLEYDDVENGLSQPQLREEDFAPYHQFLQRNAKLRNRQQHRQLTKDLIEHIWQFHNARRQL
ncbi:hypothetical protein Ahy_B09g099706 isoform B [Arachis hypogaea]|nr:hypothetical protein Ahy_B09g099706 isoform B [Arachis hypogaea]